VLYEAMKAIGFGILIGALVVCAFYGALWLLDLIRARHIRREEMARAKRMNEEAYRRYMRSLAVLLLVGLVSCTADEPTAPTVVVSPSPSPSPSPTPDPAECIQTDLRIYAPDGHSRPAPDCVVLEYCDLFARPLNKYGTVLEPRCGVGQVFGWSLASADGALCDIFGDRTSPRVSMFCTERGKVDITTTNNGFKAVGSFRVVR
jgi:hypothetical protein